MSVEVRIYKVEGRCKVLDEQAGGAQRLLCGPSTSLWPDALAGASEREVEQIGVDGWKLLN